MRIDEIVILTLKYLSNEKREVEGRTLLQKVIYFLNEKLNLGIPFIPYYYGPYSEKITNALEELKSVGMIEERIENYSSDMPWICAFEPRLYKYTLKEFGLKFAEVIEGKYEEEAKKIEKTIKEIRSTFKRNVKLLSVAGKMLTILKLKNKPMHPKNILEEAKALNWDISEQEAKEAIDSLKKIKLVEIVSKSNA